MRVEVLYAKIANLYGDQGNVLLLKKTLPSAYFDETDLNDTPRFVSSKPDLIIMGSMSEDMQEKVITRLMPFRQRIIDLIDQGISFLITGNAFDIFGEGMHREDGRFIEGLNLFKFITKENKQQRHNSLVLGHFKNLEVVAFKTQFSQMYPSTTLNHFLRIERGTGYHVGSKFEGFHRNRFYGTNCVGPLLVLNPFFTIILLKGMGIQNPIIPHQEALIAAYRKRILEFRDPHIINHP